MALVVVVFVAFVVFMMAGTLVMTTLGLYFGVRVRELSFGVGKTLWSREAKGSALIIKLIPISSYVRFSDNRFPESRDEPGWSIDSKPGWVRVLIPAAGVLVPFAVSAVLLGRDAPRQIASAVPQILGGALSPGGAAQELLAGFEGWLVEHGLLMGVALVVVKLGTLMLVPFSPTTGLGQALCALRKTEGGPVFQGWAVLSSLLVMAIGGSWLFALLRYWAA